MNPRAYLVGALLFLGGVWVFVPDETEYQRSGVNDPDNLTSTEAPRTARTASTAEDPSLLQGEPRDSARVPVTVEASSAGSPSEQLVADDPCAAVAAERDALREQLSEVRLEIERLRYPADTPYGHFLRSYEAKQITDPAMRDKVRYTLDDIPVVLRPGEASWIVRRYQEKDWKSYAPTVEEAVIRFLGPQRVLREAPPSWVESQRDWYDDEEWLALFGTPKPH